MNLPRLSRFAQRLAFREWLLLTCVLTLLAAGLGWQNGLGRIDQSLYDLLLSANGRPARDDILIVAIDDYSIAELGRWPWPRARHAKLLNNIAAAAPRAIGLDVILSEPELAADGNRAGDHALAAALAANHLTVLPVTGASRGAGLTITPPIAELACAARALGHINLQLDSDGVLRSFAPHTFHDGVWWPHFALALAADLQLPAGGNCEPAFNPTAATTTVSSADTLLRIPFAGGSGHFQSVPYVAVLRGEVPPQFLAGKYVLVGATALGMADSYPTPVSGLNGAMAGIEINANILASLLEGKSIALAAPWQTALFCALPVFLALFGYLFFSPRQSLLSTAGLLLLTLVASCLALRAGIWLAPGAALTALVLSYPAVELAPAGNRDFLSGPGIHAARPGAAPAAGGGCHRERRAAGRLAGAAHPRHDQCRAARARLAPVRVRQPEQLPRCGADHRARRPGAAEQPPCAHLSGHAGPDDGRNRRCCSGCTPRSRRRKQSTSVPT